MSSVIELFDNLSGQYVDALLHERIKPALAAVAEKSWNDFIAEAKNKAQTVSQPAPEMEHEGWRWYEKVNLSYNLLPYPTLAIECAGDIQGLMLLKTDGCHARLKAEIGKPIVYIELLSAAPWNLEKYITQPKYAGVGTLLIGAAIRISMDYGFKGRLGLNSLPQSESFYERYNFEYLGRDSNKQNLKYYELSAENAAKFLK